MLWDNGQLSSLFGNLLLNFSTARLNPGLAETNYGSQPYSTAFLLDNGIVDMVWQNYVHVFPYSYP